MQSKAFSSQICGVLEQAQRGEKHHHCVRVGEVQGGLRGGGDGGTHFFLSFGEEIIEGRTRHFLVEFVAVSIDVIVSEVLGKVEQQDLLGGEYVAPGRGFIGTPSHLKSAKKTQTLPCPVSPELITKQIGQSEGSN